MPFGNHLGAYQYVHITGMNGCELGLQGAFEARGVGINSRHPNGFAVWELRAFSTRAANVGKQRG
jgi:hypothetical protein